MQVRRVLAVFAAGVAASLVLSWSVRGDEAPGPAPGAAPAGVGVEIERLDGSKVAGRFAAPLLKFQTRHGVIDLDVSKVKRLDLTPPVAPETTVTANVTLTDQSHMAGPLLSEAITIDAPGTGPVTLRFADLSEVKFLQPRDTSLVGLGVGLLTLTVMEIVLGVDNIIFLAILAGRLPEEQRPRARKIGLAAALGTRLLLLFGLSTLMDLNKPIFTLPEMPFLDTVEARGVSWRDVVLLVGGMFLIGKSVFEMHEKVESARSGTDAPAPRASFVRVIVMMALFDIVFSLDSVITAVGMVEEIWVMVAAMIVSSLVMLGFSGPISRFVDKHPTIKVLALSFLVLIGVILVAEGMGQHINKGYIYFAMAFAVGVEFVNLQLRGDGEGKAPKPV